MRKTLYISLICFLTMAPSAFAGNAMEIDMEFSSYAFLKVIIRNAELYFKNTHEMLMDSGVLTALAVTCVTMAIVVLAFKVLRKGLAHETIWEAGQVIGISLLASAIVLNTKILFDILVFAVKFPLDLATFFMSTIGDGAGDILAKNGTSISDMKSLFDLLDANFMLIVGFCMRLLPSENLMFGFSQILFKLCLLVLLPFFYLKIYLGALRGIVVSCCLIVINIILAPFFGVLAIFPKSRSYIVSLMQGTFYHWLNIVVTSIITAMVVSVMVGMTNQLTEINNNNQLLANGLYFFLLAWLWVSSSLLGAASSYVSQITGIRGTSDKGGSSVIALASGAGGLFFGQGAMRALAQQIGKAIQKGSVNGQAGSFSEKQKRNATRP
jgi:flagellar biosynthesis protein FliQ